MPAHRYQKTKAWIFTFILHLCILAFAFFFTAWTPMDFSQEEMGFQISMSSLNTSSRYQKTNPRPQPAQKQTKPTTKEEENSLEHLDETEQSELQNTNTESENSEDSTEEIANEDSLLNESDSTVEPTPEPPVINQDALLKPDDISNQNSGNSSNIKLNLPGWIWESAPDKKDSTSETGKVVLQIKIDEEGEVLSVKVLFRSVSLKVAEFYMREVEKLTFIPRDEERKEGFTEGTITFILAYKN